MEHPTWLDYVIPAIMVTCLVLGVVVVPIVFWVLERIDSVAGLVRQIARGVRAVRGAAGQLAAALAAWARAWWAAEIAQARARAAAHEARLQPPAAPAPVPTVPALPAPRTSGAPGADAVRAGAPGAQEAAAPVRASALTGAQRELAAQIAGHKLRQPADGKSATARALGIARGSGSQRYADFSVAWDLLFPPPATPAAPEYISDRDSRIRAQVLGGGSTW